jgi:hypothetical protein
VRQLRTNDSLALGPHTLHMSCSCCLCCLQQCEDLEDTASLHLLFRVMRCMVMLNDTQVGG